MINVRYAVLSQFARRSAGEFTNQIQTAFKLRGGLLVSVLISNIQRFVIHDGGGIRTTVFFKGCPLRCRWCHNPETWSFEDDGSGFACSTSELVGICLRDSIFYGDSGGVTVSGGEPLAQDVGYIAEFLRGLKAYGIHVACDTCGDVPWESFEAVLPFVDTFLYDMKLASREAHARFTGVGNERIIANLRRLGSFAEVWLRIPVIGGVNCADEVCNEANNEANNEMADMISLAKSTVPGCKVFLLPYHNLGTGKPGRNSKQLIETRPPQPQFTTPSDALMNAIATQWTSAGFII